MAITFNCSNCGSEFTVGDQLAGRTGRCKKCGHRLVIPAKAARQPALVGAGAQAPRAGKANAAPRQSPVGRLLAAVSQVAMSPVSDEWNAPPARRPKAAPPARPAGPRSMNWAEAVNSQIGLKPITMDNMPLVRLTKDDEEFEDSSPYNLAKTIPPEEAPKKAARGPGVVKTSYRDTFKLAAKFFRRINEVAYGLSIFFIMMACVGFCLQVYEAGKGTPPQPEPSLLTQTMSERAAQPPEPPPPPVRQHRLTTIGIAGIVVLNLVRLISGLANIVMIPFRKNPVRGFLFLIPPLTFFYMREHWKQFEKPVKRIIGPVFALGVVVLAYAFVPGLSNASRSDDRVDSAMKEIRSDVREEVGEAKEGIGSVKKDVETKLPGAVDKVKETFEETQDKLEQKAEDRFAPEAVNPSGK